MVVGRVDRFAEFGQNDFWPRPALVRVVLDAMTRSLYSISPSPGPLSPSFSDDSSSLDGAPSNLTDIHDGAQLAASRPGSPTRRGQPANAAPAPDVVTCQWEDCGAAFDDLNTFIRHLHEGAARNFGHPTPTPSAWLTSHDSFGAP